MMGLLPACGAGRRRGQRGDKAQGNEGRVAGHREQIVRTATRRPIETGQYAGQGSLPQEGSVVQNRQPERREAAGVAVGRDGYVRQADSSDDASEHGPTAEVEQRLIAAAHAARGTAGQHEAHDAGHGKENLGRTMGFEPTTSKTTTWRSTN